ncbi:MAG TPA: hypothetical protein VER11_03020 [Polyangiaceae bacterium]|nr:hypothetical protein [Polyangiaceae bacterium]
MRRVDKGGGGQVFFTYDASGQRVRKVWEHGVVEVLTCCRRLVRHRKPPKSCQKLASPSYLT